MICPKCGAKLEDGIRICPVCGKNLTATSVGSVFKRRDLQDYDELSLENDLDDTNEYDEDDFFDDDEYDDEYEEKPKKSIFRREKTHDESDEDDYELPAKSQQRPARSNNKVTPMRQPARRTGVSMEVCVIKPTSVEDAREITETLLSGRTVILNLEGLDLEVAQRIIDFTSGATYAISGNLQKISNYIFLVTPTNVDISGDLQDLLNTSLDTSSMRTRF